MKLKLFFISAVLFGSASSFGAELDRLRCTFGSKDVIGKKDPTYNQWEVQFEKVGLNIEARAEFLNGLSIEIFREGHFLIDLNVPMPFYGPTEKSDPISIDMEVADKNGNAFPVFCDFNIRIVAAPLLD